MSTQQPLNESASKNSVLWSWIRNDLVRIRIWILPLKPGQLKKWQMLSVQWDCPKTFTAFERKCVCNEWRIVLFLGKMCLNFTFFLAKKYRIRSDSYPTNLDRRNSWGNKKKYRKSCNLILITLIWWAIQLLARKYSFYVRKNLINKDSLEVGKESM